MQTATHIKLGFGDFHDCGRGNHIENEAAYAAGRKARMQANARQGKAARWLVEGVDRPAFVARLAREAAKDAFLRKMHDSYEEWGTLTENQEAAVRRSFDKTDGKCAEMRKLDSGSEFVGAVGERRDFRLNVRAVTSIEGDTYSFVLTIFADEAGNVVVYKGNTLGTTRREVGSPYSELVPVKRGDVVVLKASIKAHAERQGVKQTVVNRPKLLSVEAGR